MRRSVALTLVLVMALCACGDDDQGVSADPPGRIQPVPPSEAPYVTGPVSSISVATDRPDGCPEPGDAGADTGAGGSVSDGDLPVCGSTGDGVLGSFTIAAGTGTGEVDAASVTITAETRLLVSDQAGGWFPGRLSDLFAGVQVTVWVGENGVAESYPVQFTASDVTYEILE